MTKATVRESVRVRSAPRIAPETFIGMLPEGAVIDVKRLVNVGSITWAEYDLLAGQTAVGSGFSAAEYLNVGTVVEPPPPPPPPASGLPRVGVNALNRQAEVCAPALQRGCRFFLILNDPGFASKIKTDFPDSIVMVRAFWERRMPGIDEAINKLGGCGDSRLIYTGLNEADECPQDADGIRRRAEFDVALATRIKQISGATYAAGTFSMGTPDFTDARINDVMRQVYAPHYNSGLMSWDHHLYSPTLDHVFQPAELIWFETRWRFLFTHCGFNPASPSRVYCSETGEDEGGVGGFPAHNRTPEQVAAWCREWQRQQAAPLVVDGVSHPSPFVGGAIFQVGNREDWAGYNVERFYDALEGVWRPAAPKGLRAPAARGRKVTAKAARAKKTPAKRTSAKKAVPKKTSRAKRPPAPKMPKG